MNRSRTPLGVRLLVICELLFITGWICLLFQWQPGVIAAVPLAVATPTAEYRALSHGIDEQLAKARAANENEGVLEMAFWPNSNLGNVFVEPAVDETSPAIAAAAALPNSISHGEFGLTNTVLSKPVPPAPAARQEARHGESRPPAPNCPYRVSSIIYSTSRSTAVLINTETGESAFVNAGQSIGEWSVLAITDSTVTLRAADYRRTLAIE